MSKTQKLHSENLTMFNNNYLLFDKRATNSLKKRLDLPLNFNRSKKINLQLTFLLLLLTEGKIKPTLKDAENRMTQPDQIEEPTPQYNIVYPPKPGPLTLDELEKYNVDYYDELKKQPIQFFNDNKFISLEDTAINTGNIKGGFSILNKLLKNNEFINNNVILTTYGFNRITKTLNNIVDIDDETGQIRILKSQPGEKNGYIIDPYYNFIVKRTIMNNEQLKQNNKDAYKSLLIKLFNAANNSSEQIITLKLHLEPITTAEIYNHHFKYGKINCFLSSLYKHILYDSQREKNEATKKILKQKLELLNDTYFNSGVTFRDIPNIEKYLSVKIYVVNKAGQLIFKSNEDNNINKRQIITLESPYIDHISDYMENEKKEMNQKQKIMVDDINDHYLNNISDYKYYKKNSDDNIIYYYDEYKIYYQSFKINNIIVNEDEIYIYNGLTYHKQKFLNDNNLLNNSINNKDELFFNFINNSCHHIDKYINLDLLKKLYGNQKLIKINNEDNENIFNIDENDTYKQLNLKFHSIDNNKCFIGFLNKETQAGRIYEKLGVPNNKFNFYQINEDPTQEYKDIIFNGANISFIEVDNICYINETIKNMNLIKNGYIYTSFFLKYCIDNNIIKNNFEWRTIATASHFQKLVFSDDIIINKYYNEIIGTMSSNQDYSILNFECKNIADIKDILYYQTLNNDPNNKILTYNKTVSIYSKKKVKSNRAHISSCILSYALINIIDVVKDVDINNLLYVKCDGISTLKKIENIKMSSNFGEWKTENKKYINVSYHTEFINHKEPLIYTEYQILPLTINKQIYKSVNFITGAAGTGKTSQFLKSFDKTDERIYNSVLLVPSNCLLFKLKEQYPEMNIYTYQSFIMAFYQFEDTHRANKLIFQKFYNILLDESTMINATEMSKILKICKNNNMNLFIIGDYDINEKKSYQLKPPTGDEFFKALTSDNPEILNIKKHSYANKKKVIFYGSLVKELKDKTIKKNINNVIENFKNDFKYIKTLNNKKNVNKDDIIYNGFKLHLTKNHRQHNNIKLTNLLKNCRGKDNEYIKSIILNYPLVQKIKYNDVLKMDINGQILSPVNRYIDKINNDINNLKNDDDYIKVLYLKTTSENAKNEITTIIKKDFDANKLKLAYAISAHKCQGLTYTDNIYININNLFCDNLLYVMLSRAQRLEQIFLINE